MRATKIERTRAEQVAAAIDQFLRDPGAKPEQLDQADVELLDTARQLARLPLLLGPVDPTLEQRVVGRVRARTGRARQVHHVRPGWVVAGIMAVLLVVTLLSPLGQTAVASFMAVFSLGRTEVRITPVDTPAQALATAAAQSTAVQQRLTLDEAQAQVKFAIPQPAHLLPGYQLRGVNSYTYPDLPAWVPQPLFLELVYGEESGREFLLRLYPIILGDDASIAGLNLQAAPIHDVQDVDVNGQPGVLLRLGTDRTGAAWQEVVWEHGDLILALSAVHLSEVDLLDIARSVR